MIKAKHVFRYFQDSQCTPLLGCLISMLHLLKNKMKPHQSCFLTAWPFNVSTLKLFVRAGMMKNATTVTSLWLTCDSPKQYGVKFHHLGSPPPQTHTRKCFYYQLTQLHLNALTLSRQLSLAKASKKMSAPLLENSYLPAMKRNKHLSRLKSRCLMVKTNQNMSHNTDEWNSDNVFIISN